MYRYVHVPLRVVLSQSYVLPIIVVGSLIGWLVGIVQPQSPATENVENFSENF